MLSWERSHEWGRSGDRALMDRYTRDARGGLWPSGLIDGHSPSHLAFYRRLGFRLIAAVPDWFGDGTAKTILR
jgi:hypothetical protein